MTVLLFGNKAIGDNISFVLPLYKYLSLSYTVDCILPNFEAFKLFSNIPFIKNLSLADNLDGAEYTKIFPNYDKVYLCSRGMYSRFANFGENICSDIKKETKINYWPHDIFDRFGFEYLSEYGVLDIDWYKDYYIDFNCSSKSVLLHTVASVESKSYNKKDELKSLLEKEGFEVFTIDLEMDIRSNLHLINQVKYILTVDTSVVWMAFALGKEPFVFMYRKEYTEGLLGLKNLVPWYSTLNEIPPDVIANCFLGRLIHS